MRDFSGRIAVVTGGGSGMGRELVRQLAAEGCNVAMCDVSATAMAETQRACAEGRSQGQGGNGPRVTAHVVDVADKAQVTRFRDEVATQHQSDHIHFLFNNAGIGGGGSFVTADQDEWERTFNINWYGVYYNTRAFLPLLLRADDGHIVNTSSVNGFWACLMPGVSHTAYSSAKFAVKGFTEALVVDLRNNAPHLQASVVMPGHIGTRIGFNSRRVLAGRDDDRMGAAEIAAARQMLSALDPANADRPDDEIEHLVTAAMKRFEDNAPTTAAEAARIILDGVKARRWRILIGDDARRIDERVRAHPEQAYDLDFLDGFGAFIEHGAPAAK